MRACGTIIKATNLPEVDDEQPNSYCIIELEDCSSTKTSFIVDESSDPVFDFDFQFDGVDTEAGAFHVQVLAKHQDKTQEDELIGECKLQFNEFTDEEVTKEYPLLTLSGENTGANVTIKTYLSEGDDINKPATPKSESASNAEPRTPTTPRSRSPASPEKSPRTPQERLRQRIIRIKAGPTDQIAEDEEQPSPEDLEEELREIEEKSRRNAEREYNNFLERSFPMLVANSQDFPEGTEEEEEEQGEAIEDPDNV